MLILMSACLLDVFLHSAMDPDRRVKTDRDKNPALYYLIINTMLAYFLKALYMFKAVLNTPSGVLTRISFYLCM